MRIGDHTNGRNCEYDMQDVLQQKYIDHNKYWENIYDSESISVKLKREVHVPEVGRRADFLIFQDGKLINVEAKSNATEKLIEQLDDHAVYCDYCFAYIPDYSMTPKWFKEKLFEKGYGLIVYGYHDKIAIEALEAHKNKGINNNLKKEIIKKHFSQLEIL